MKVRLLFFILLFLGSLAAHAQNTASLQGVVVDSTTRQAIAFADVVLRDEGAVAVAQTLVSDGRFSLDLQRIKKGKYQVLILLNGYATYVSDFLSLSPSQDFQLGTIALVEQGIVLDEVAVVGERKQIVYKLDKRSISASTNMLAAGGTAVDVLENTPSVRVSADGEITFRGSTGFLVYVNGKPSALSGTQALEQIPASQIDHIDIITTPSAKYETDGDVGMIDIITKRSYGEGLSGVVNATGSTVGTWAFDFLINKQHGKTRWFFGGNASHRRRESDFDQTKTTIVDQITTTSHSIGPRVGLNKAYYVKGGWEYIDDKNTFLAELETGYSRNRRTGDMRYEEHRVLPDSLHDALYNSYDVYALEQDYAIMNLNYAHKFNENGHRLTASYYLKPDWDALEYYESNMYDMKQRRVDGTRAYEAEHRWSMKGNLDYVFPYSENGKLEAGYQYSFYSEHGDYSIKFWDKEVYDYYWRDDLYTTYYYQRVMNSLYAIWSDRLDAFEFQAGVRAEHTYDLLDISMDWANRNNKRLEFFPSAHISYHAPRQNVFTLGFSHRTNRPNIWQLEPYITYEDYYTAMVGNPDILPEYINAFELTYRKTFQHNQTLSATLFHRARRDKMERIRVAYEAGVTLDSLANVGRDYSSGLELNAQWPVRPWWTTTLNGSGYYYRFLATTPIGRDADSYNYEVMWNNSFTISPTTRLQFDANVVGPSVTSQGRDDAYYYFNLSARQQLLKRKLTVSLVCRDLFNTARYNSTRTTATLSSVTRIKPVYPSITLSLTYTFNNFKLHEAKSEADHDLFEGTLF